MNDLSKLIGRVLDQVSVSDDEIMLHTEDGGHLIMYHSQDCCESVYVESVVGDIPDIIGSPILSAEESTNSHETPEGSETYTFYKIDTAKGGITIRWVGESNGYYSESVDCSWSDGGW